MHRRAAALRLVAGACAAVLTSACSSSAPPPTAGDLGLSGVLVEQRADVELDRVEVELGVAPGAPALHVRRVELVTPAFPAARAVSDPLLLTPGVPVDTPVAYGRPRCSASGAPGSAAPPAAAPPTARVLLAGHADPVVVRLADEDRSLERAHQRACTALEVARALPLAWDRTWTTVGSGPDLRARGVLRAGQSLDLALLLTPARCDAHALADDKRGFAPQLSVRLGAGAPVLAYAWVARADREVATDAYSTACGLG